jgi:hypothetical protein
LSIRLGRRGLVDAADYVGEVEDEAATPNGPSKARKPAKPAKRKVVEVDLDSNVSLAACADKYPPKSEQDRYLLAVAFLCEEKRYRRC